MRAASSRIWFSTSNNQPVIYSNTQPITYPDNQQADHSAHTDHPANGPRARRHRPDKHPQAQQPNNSDCSPVSVNSTSHGAPFGHVLRTSLVQGYGQLVTDRVHVGWSCHLVTVMFGPIPGRTGTRGDRMKDEVQRVFSTLLTRVHRKPRTAAPDELPVLIGALDLPVYKQDRSSVVSVLRNCGLHFHAIVLLPPRSRLKGSLADHFQANHLLYAGPTKLVERIHVVRTDVGVLDDMQFIDSPRLNLTLVQR